MNSTPRFRHLLAALALGAFPLSRMVAQTAVPNVLQTLLQGVSAPPNDAKPMVRWWWFGPAVTKPEIQRELKQMHADGIGGAELAFVYPEVLDGENPVDSTVSFKNLPFLSAQMLDAVRYAQSEGIRLGLRIDVTLCSGWPYGGPHITLQEAATRLRVITVKLASGAESVPLPPLREEESLIAASVVQGEPDKWNPMSEQPLKLQPGPISVPPGRDARTVLFFVLSHTRQEVKRASVGAEGYVLDVFSHDAVAKHLKVVGDPLLSAFGAAPPYAVFSDSLEAYGADWTPDLPAQFLKRRGYDLLPHLPELVAGGSAAAEIVRHDYGRTLKELVDENYLKQINLWASAHGTRFRSQTYGDPSVSFSSQSLVALPEGEGPQWRAFSTLRWATSANHIFANNVTSGETYTWLHSPVFRATPLDMKVEADIDFIMGENQLIFHGWPYSPPSTELKPGDPGWSLYAAAVFNDHNPWYPVMPAVTQYITRVSWLLRQGEPANQVAVLLPTDDAWAGFAPGKVSVTEAMKNLISPALMTSILGDGSAGGSHYNLDYIDADAIEKIGLNNYQILVLPPTDRIPTATLTKVAAFSRAGGKVISVGHAPSLNEEGMPLAASFLSLVKNAVAVSDEAHLAVALQQAAPADLRLMPVGDTSPGLLRNVGFIRRKLTGADIYFVANTSNQPVRMLATFTTPHTFGQQIDPDLGASINTNKTALGDMQAAVTLAPYESRIFLFTDSDLKAGRLLSTPAKRTDLNSGWQLTFTSTGKTTSETKLRDWTADPVTLHYSGEVVCARNFELKVKPGAKTYLEVDGGQAIPGAPDASQKPKTLTKDGLPDPLVTQPGPGMWAYFDPPIREAALVTVNDQPAGALWHPPYRLDISKLVKQGMNHIEIHVFNTALNAWSALPPRDYGPLKAVYGDRFQMQDLDKVKPLPSGILGFISVITQASQ